ncbi:aminoglycoside phosphotransferase [Gammaproteobacteria bacterium LSUCC0112]|nr:aminoglycoside phosphotransferase [Gammaproteobacteria bacterium LSUCC0112]
MSQQDPFMGPDSNGPDDIRQQQLQDWARGALRSQSGSDPGPIHAVALGGDASFRRYFRYHSQLELTSVGLEGLTHSLLLVDAPPERENNPAFVLAAQEFRAAGLKTPTILAHDFEQGFMLLEDFGDQLYLPCLQAALGDADQDVSDIERVDELYNQAMKALLMLQSDRSESQLPAYDQARLHTELCLFDEWFCGQMLGLALDANEKTLLAQMWAFLEQAALNQVQVRVHRDYHSRNLMVRQQADGSLPEDQLPGIIDFQDAVIGPVTYDLVSLLRDCYIVWPTEHVNRWLRHYYFEARARDILPDSLSFDAFQRDVDLMGIQRHIKVLGIFCRLALRDNKPRYLLDLPVVMDYVVTVGERHPELKPFINWFRRGPMIDMYAVLTASGPMVSASDMAAQFETNHS